MSYRIFPDISRDPLHWRVGEELNLKNVYCIKKAQWINDEQEDTPGEHRIQNPTAWTEHDNASPAACKGHHQVCPQYGAIHNLVRHSRVWSASWIQADRPDHSWVEWSLEPWQLVVPRPCHQPKYLVIASHIYVAGVRKCILRSFGTFLVPTFQAFCCCRPWFWNACMYWLVATKILTDAHVPNYRHTMVV